MSELEPDPRTEAPGICGVTYIGGTGLEWICIRPVHSKTYQRNNGDRTHNKGDLIYQDGGAADQHYMVTRWKYRSRQPLA